MKKVSLIFLLISLKANAWQLNPSYILNSPNSENCIGATYKIGDKIASAAGSENYALVKSISGTSTRCQQDPQIALQKRWLKSKVFGHTIKI